VYEDLIKDESLLPKALVIKLVTESDDKSSYNATIADPKTSLKHKKLNEELNRIIELNI